MPKNNIPEIKKQTITKEKTRRYEEKKAKIKKEKERELETWQPKTEIGKDVKAGKIKDISQILDNGLNILESQIVDILLPDLKVDLLMIGQSKGKFGGGQKRVFRQTQKKTPEGNKPKFSTCAIIGNENGYIGIGFGKSKETVPAREKAIRNAKINIMKIKRGCGSWQCSCKAPHTIPFTATGKCGSVVIKLMPAPKGTGLRVEHEIAKILKLAGIKDIWSKTFGKTNTKQNLINACINALQNLITTKTRTEDIERLGIKEGIIKKKEEKKEEKNNEEN